MAIPKKKLDEIFQGVHSGKIDIDNLPKELSQFTYTELMAFVSDGFGDLDSPVKINRMAAYDNNISAFSGAKTFQQVKDLNSFVFTAEGAKRPFKEFREFAQVINDQYNKVWLKTEQDSAFRMSKQADNWIDNIEKEKELFPFLQYQTVNDGRVRNEHAAWDNIVKRVDDPFWDTRYPPNDFNCRCIVIRKTEGNETNLKTHLEKYNKNNPDAKVPTLKNTSDLFNVNSGKVNYIFNEKKHPYFQHTRAEGPAFKKGMEWQSKE
jgi:SPP1 gp7 family putative phage head morphogenesis protein